MSGRAAGRSIGDYEDILRDAVAAHAAGDHAAAERGYREVLAAVSGHVAALELLGMLCLQTGRAEEARGLLRRAVALRPSHAGIRQRLGMTEEALGDFPAAAVHYARALALDPGMAAAHFGLGFCHEAAGRPAEAMACYRRAIACAPEHARAHNNLAGLLAETDPAEAEALLRRAAALDPRYPEARNNLGALLLAAGRAVEAEAVLAEALALRPGYADALANRGSALHLLGREAEAVASLRAALAADPAAIEPRWVLATVQAERGDGAAAEATLRDALAQHPQHPGTRLRLAQLLHHRGQFAAAEALFAPLAAAGPRRGTALYGLVQTRRMTAADGDLIAAMRDLGEDVQQPAAERAAVLFGLGKALADIGEEAEAMRAFDAANALHRATLPPFDRAAHAAMVDRLIATFTPALFAGRGDRTSGSARPLLIVGMMRSGTTLLEQMLAGHPAVAAGGELTYWGRHGGGQLPADAAAAAVLIAGYDAELARISADAPRVTDKLPHNIYALGLIHLLYPQARILHVRRDPADTGLSIYRTLFGAPHEFAYDQDDIVFVLREYARLAAHWRAVLAEHAMLEVRYESLVAAPEPVARDVLAFCGLEWDAAVLDHAAQRRMIRTASAWQARQPVYTDAAGTARRFAPHLGALRALLG